MDNMIARKTSCGKVTLTMTELDAALLRTLVGAISGPHHSEKNEPLLISIGSVDTKKAVRQMVSRAYIPLSTLMDKVG